jgi:hypothetical protein
MIFGNAVKNMPYKLGIVKRIQKQIDKFGVTKKCLNFAPICFAAGTGTHLQQVPF